MGNKTITCPKCGHNFNVEEALSGELEAHFKAEFEKKSSQLVERFDNERKLLEAERSILEEQKEAYNEKIKEELAKRMEKEKEKAEKEISESYEDKIKMLEEENERKRADNKLLREREVALLQQQSKLKDKEEELNLKLERQLLERAKEIETKARENEQEKFAVEKAELLKKIEDNKKLANEMRRRAEQGSMQLQGEAQELALEEILTREYPFDEITEVPKGVKGADTIQNVFNTNQQKCGSIVYESKNTKNFSNEWIEKLKQDQLSCKADIAVLVTAAFPQGMSRFEQKDGIWICGFHEIKSLSFVLRDMLVRVHSVRKAEENKGDRMELLYNYLTGTEFVQNVKIIVENYDSMYKQLNDEKKAMTKLWALREKQIWTVQQNISILFGSIKGIAGEELETSNILQLLVHNEEG